MFHVNRIGMPIDSYIGMPIFLRIMTYDELLEHYGTQKAAGEALGAFGDGEAVKQSSVAEWKDKGIPTPRQAQYELLTNGQLKAERAANGVLNTDEAATGIARAI